MANIKISQLPSIGNGLSASTILPVVNTTGVATTDKVAVGNIANFTLLQAGNTLPPAFVSTIAYSVANAAQPNITSVGTLSVNTLKISGGTNGYILQTDGAGNLAWVAGGGSGNGEVGGSNGQIQFNNEGNFGGDDSLTWDVANALLGTVNFAAEQATIYGNVDTINVNATGNVRPNAIYTDHYYYANGYVFGGGGGNGVPGGATTQVQFNDGGVFAGNTGFTFNKTSGLLSATLLAGGGNGLSNIQGANITGFVANANVANTAFAVAGANVTGAVSYAGTANSVAVANVVGLGNIATLSLSGSSSNVLYGNGAFAPVSTTYGNSDVANYLPTYTGGNIGSSAGGQGVTNLNLAGNIVATPQLMSINWSIYHMDFSQYGRVELNSDFFANANVVGAQYLKGDGSNITNVNAPRVINGTSNVDIPTTNGNVVITTAGTEQWIFDQFGILTFPDGTEMGDVEGSNTFGFYSNNANMQFLLEASSNNWVFDGATSNFTTPSNLVIGANSGGGSSIYQFDAPLQVLGEGANSAVIVGWTANSSGPEDVVAIAFNNPLATGASNLVIGVGNNATTVNYWNFDNTGNLTLPGNTFAVNYANGTQVSLGANTGNVTFDNINVIGTGNLNLQPDPANSGSYLDIFLSSGPDIHIVASASANLILGKDDQSNVMTSWDGNVYIQSWDNNTNTQGGVWSFDGTGNLGLPGGGSIYSQSSTPSGAPGNTITLQPAGSGTITNQKLMIYPTAGDGDHIHMVTGNLYQTELFMGSDNFYMKLANTGNIVLNANDDTGNIAQLVLGSDANLVLPTVTVGSGLTEQAVVRSQRKIIPAYHYSVAIDGATPTVVYTASSSNISSLKMTISITHGGLGQEMFDISAMTAGANVMYNVSNRLNGTGQPDTTVSVDYIGGGPVSLAVTLTVNSGATNSWVTYDSTEFGYQVD